MSSTGAVIEHLQINTSRTDQLMQGGFTHMEHVNNLHSFRATRHPRLDLLLNSGNTSSIQPMKYLRCSQNPWVMGKYVLNGWKHNTSAPFLPWCVFGRRHIYCSSSFQTRCSRPTFDPLWQRGLTPQHALPWPISRSALLCLSGRAARWSDRREGAANPAANNKTSDAQTKHTVNTPKTRVNTENTHWRLTPNTADHFRHIS